MDTIYIDSYFASRNITIRPEFELGSIDLLLEFARNSLGVSFVVKEFAGQHIDGSSLFEIALQSPIPPRSVAIATLSGISPSQAAKVFI